MLMRRLTQKVMEGDVVVALQAEESGVWKMVQIHQPKKRLGW